MKKWLIKNQFALIIIGIATLIIGVISIFAWLFVANNDVVEGKHYIPTGEYALLDLGTTNCEPCKRLQIVLSELQEEYGEKIDFVTFDITNTIDGAAMANGYKVNIMPTLIFVDKSGKEIKRETGFRSKEQIEQIFKELRWIK